MHVISSFKVRAEVREIRGLRLTETKFKKKNATMLCVYDLDRMKKVKNTISSINTIMGEKNVISYYFPRRVGELHT